MYGYNTNGHDVAVYFIRNTKYNSTIASDVLQCNIVNKYKDNEDNELEPDM